MLYAPRVTGAHGPTEDDFQSDGATPGAPGRTAFDALNPYGDFGGTEVSRTQLVAVGLVCLLAVGGVLAVGGFWASEALTAANAEALETTKPTASSAQEGPSSSSAAPSPPALAPPAAEPPAATNDAPPPAAVDEPPPSPPGDARAKESAPAPSAPSAPAQPRPSVPKKKPKPVDPPAFVLSSVRDHSDAEVDGLDDALERGFRSRLQELAPDVRVKRGRPRSVDLGARVLLMRLDEEPRRGVHTVTARCALATRPKEALPTGPLRAERKERGPEGTDALRAEAARRCGAQLADAFAPTLRQFLK